MTSLEKAIDLRYIFLTLNPPPPKISIHAPISAACIGVFQFIQKSVFDPNTCTLNRFPLTGTVDVHYVNFPIWGWNNTPTKMEKSTCGIITYPTNKDDLHKYQKIILSDEFDWDPSNNLFGISSME